MFSALLTCTRNRPYKTLTCIQDISYMVQHPQAETEARQNYLLCIFQFFMELSRISFFQCPQTTKFQPSRNKNNVRHISKTENSNFPLLASVLLEGCKREEGWTSGGMENFIVTLLLFGMKEGWKLHM